MSPEEDAIETISMPERPTPQSAPLVSLERTSVSTSSTLPVPERATFTSLKDRRLAGLICCYQKEGAEAVSPHEKVQPLTGPPPRRATDSGVPSTSTSSSSRQLPRSSSCAEHDQFLIPGRLPPVEDTQRRPDQRKHLPPLYPRLRTQSEAGTAPSGPAEKLRGKGIAGEGQAGEKRDLMRSSDLQNDQRSSLQKQGSIAASDHVAITIPELPRCTSLPSEVLTTIRQSTSGHESAQVAQLTTWPDLAEWLVPDGRGRYWAIFTFLILITLFSAYFFMAGTYAVYNLNQDFQQETTIQLAQSVNGTAWGPSSLGSWLIFWEAPTANVFDFTYLRAWGGRYNPDIQAGQWWRWFSSLIIHESCMHIVSNVLLLSVLSGFLEHNYGFLRVASVYLIAGLGGNFTSAMFEASCTLVVGASGCIFGLIGFFLADIILNWQALILPWFRLAGMIICSTILVVFEVPKVSSTMGTVSVSYYSHAGGFLIGTAASFLFLPHLQDKRWQAIRFWAVKVGLKEWIPAELGGGEPPVEALSEPPQLTLTPQPTLTPMETITEEIRDSTPKVAERVIVITDAGSAGYSAGGSSSGSGSEIRDLSVDLPRLPRSRTSSQGLNADRTTPNERPSNASKPRPTTEFPGVAPSCWNRCMVLLWVLRIFAILTLLCGLLFFPLYIYLVMFPTLSCSI